MKNFSLFLLISILGILVLGVVACDMPSARNGFSIASYNVQTLFDDRLDGGEFSEYIPSAEGWNTKKYHNRLRQLSRTIRDLIEGAPDLLVLQEVENERVIRDLDRFFIRDLNYRHLAISTVGVQSVAVLSRIPFIESKILGVHWENRMLRPMVEVHFDVEAGTGGEAGGQSETGERGAANAGASGRVILYAVHWKSKREGAEETEILRRASAQALVQSIRRNMRLYPRANIIVAGDFNENIDEFAQQNASYITALMPQSEFATWQSMVGASEDSMDEGLLPLFVEFAENRDGERQGAPQGAVTGANSGIATGSADAGASPPALALADTSANSPVSTVALADLPLLYHFWEEGEGSFYFNGDWERIDQILFSEGFFNAYNSIEFWVADAWYLRDGSDRPRRYQARSASGYSDHLPILMRFSLE